MSKIGFMLMQSQYHDLFRNVYVHCLISNTIFKWNVRGKKIGPFFGEHLTPLCQATPQIQLV